MNKRDAALLADRQSRVVEDLIARARRGLKEVREVESRGEERLGNILSLVEKAQTFAPSADQLERLWAVVEQAQLAVDGLVPSVRMRYSDEGAESLDSKSLGMGHEV